MTENETLYMFCAFTGQQERIDVQWDISNGEGCSVAAEVFSANCHKEDSCSFRNSKECPMYSFLNPC